MFKDDREGEAHDFGAHLPAGWAQVGSCHLDGAEPATGRAMGLSVIRPEMPPSGAVRAGNFHRRSANLASLGGFLLSVAIIDPIAGSRSRPAGFGEERMAVKKIQNDGDAAVDEML